MSSRGRYRKRGREGSSPLINTGITLQSSGLFPEKAEYSPNAVAIKKEISVYIYIYTYTSVYIYRLQKSTNPEVSYWMENLG